MNNFEIRLQRALGDWQGEFNAWKERCPKCEGFHEEYLLVLQALTGWPCDRAAKYHQLALDLSRQASDRFAVKYRRFRRLAPYCRIGANAPGPDGETDAQYCKRMRALYDQRVDFDLLIHKTAGGPGADKSKSRAKTGPVLQTGKHRRTPNSRKDSGQRSRGSART